MYSFHLHCARPPLDEQGLTHVRAGAVRAIDVHISSTFLAASAGIGPTPKDSKSPILPLYELAILAAPLGLEPKTRESESLVLPITPQRHIGVPSGIRTHTVRGLNPMHLPIVLLGHIVRDFSLTLYKHYTKNLRKSQITFSFSL